MESFSTKFATRFLSALGLCVMVATSAHAARQTSGTWNPSQCNGATSTFVDLSSAEQAFGFGQGNKAIVLINGGAGEAGAVMKPDLDGRQQLGSDNFRNIQVTFKDDGVTREITNVHFCFRKFSTGEIFGFDKKLKDMNARPLGKTGWSVASANTLEFGGFLVRDLILYEVTFSLSGRGNVTLGDSLINMVDLSARPARLNLNVLDCTYLDTCIGQN